MDGLIGLLTTVLVTMGVLLAMGLAMGKRQIGELSPFDFAVSITSGTIAGAGIADPRIELWRVAGGLAALGLLQIGISWLTLRYHTVYTWLHHEPTVLVENGSLLKSNLRRVRLTAEMVLSLLREKEVFDISEVELAVFEPSGKISVLRKAEASPVKPSQLGIEVSPNRILAPVVLEGKVHEQVLAGLGLNRDQIADFSRQYGGAPNGVYIAFMDRSRAMHVVDEGAEDSGKFLH